MALKTDREIANLKSEDGKRKVLVVSSGAGAGLYIEERPDCVARTRLSLFTLGWVSPATTRRANDDPQKQTI